MMQFLLIVFHSVGKASKLLFFTIILPDGAKWISGVGMGVGIDVRVWFVCVS